VNARAIGAALAAVVAGTAGACTIPRYLSQAAVGQLELLTDARPIDEVIADPDVPERTRVLLAAIPGMKAFGARFGLDTARNYRTFTQLEGDAAVWFVGAAPRLSFEPRKWCFPIVGCFTGVGWFDEEDAVRHRAELERDGWDAMARPAIAYSTGGWFPDPVVSSMLSDEPDAWAELANVILHESVHATILVPDQPFFNEGAASYIADAMTDEWLVATFGPDSPERLLYRSDQAERAARVGRMLVAYQELDTLYGSAAPDRQKLARKRAIIDKVVADLALRYRPNNASLVEVRVYQASRGGFARVHASCGGLAPMVAAARRLTRKDFQADLQEALDPVMARLESLCRAPVDKKSAGQAAPAIRATPPPRKTGSPGEGSSG
jgi:predicted aminopeptidase